VENYPASIKIKIIASELNFSLEYLEMMLI